MEAHAVSIFEIKDIKDVFLVLQRVLSLFNPKKETTKCVTMKTVVINARKSVTDVAYCNTSRYKPEMDKLTGDNISLLLRAPSVYKSQRYELQVYFSECVYSMNV